MNIPAIRCISVSACQKVLLPAILALALLSRLPLSAQTTEGWASPSDNYTNGPIGGDWNPAITDSATNWPNNFNGSASSLNGYIVVITNNGACNYAGSSAGDPNYTNTINDLYIGGTGNGMGGGGISNNFVISGGSLTLADTNGPALAVGGVATGGKAGAASTNYLTMTGGTLMATNAIANTTGGCVIGFGTNSVGVVNFNGGTAVLSDLVIGGHGAGVVNINGGNVMLTGTDTNGLRAISFDTLASGNGTLNIIAGNLTVTNSQVDLGHGAIAHVSSTINMSGGTFNLGHLQFGTGSATAATNIVNFSGGTINFGTGSARNGTTETNWFIMSGGTISCLPGYNPILPGGLTHWIVTTSPGPGVVTFAPLAGQSITINDVSGAGSIDIAGPGATIEAAASTYTGGTIVSGGIFSLSTAGSVAGRIVVAANATLDVSEQAATYTLSSGQILSNSTSTAMIDGSLNTGSGTVSVLYSVGVPSFTITTNNSANTNANPATLTLSPTTTFNINNTGAALGPTNYLIISTNSEGAAVAGTPPGTVTVNGGGIQAGNTAALSIGDDGQLYLVVAAKPPPPTIGSYLPVPYTNQFLLYAGASPAFSVSASSVAPISYQWFTNGVGVAGATNPSLTLANIRAGLITNYCVVSNYAGSATSFVWTASVIAPPAAYPQSVLAQSPIGYWRLNEGSDNGGGDDGYIADDYAGGNDGIYTNVTLGSQGYNPTLDPSDTAAGFGNIAPYVNNLAGQIAGIDFAATNGANAEFSVEAWVQGEPGNEYANGEIIAKGVFNVDEAFALGIDSASIKHYRFYVRNAADTVYTADSSFTPDSNWHHLVGVCDEANGVVSLYIDGQLAASTTIPTNSGAYETPAPITIGAGITNNSPNGYTLQFFGNINDVAVFNHALTASEVAAQYENDDVAPILDPAPPSSMTANGGGTLTIPSGAIGTPPSFYWWHDANGGTNVASGSTNGPILNATLTVGSVPSTWNSDTLNLIVSNSFGGTNFTVALTVYTNAPAITQNLPTPLDLLSGEPYTYVVGVSGAAPDYYQWYANGVSAANQTNATFAITSPAAGVTNFYFVVVSNIFGATTSVVSQVVGIGQLTSAFATNIYALNPVGYWPMHEIEPAAHGDIETNYGSIGVLGTGYYGDWIGLQGIVHSNASALANDPDPSVIFAYTGANNTGDATNSLIIPHNSPLSTLNAPFTVECWVYMNNNGGGDVWSQEGAAGLDNGPNFAGIRLYAHSGGFWLYCYDGTNGSTIYSGGVLTNFSTAQWSYLVVVDDGTNINEYVNGTNLCATNLAANYAPDYWSPLSIGSGRGFTRNANCAVDEFAVYTNALSLADIATHYNDGLSGADGQYKADVLADNPPIYLRMDSPVYSPPNLLPELINYGSARNVGTYSPGTFPGAIQGMINPYGVPFIGLSGTNVAALSGVSSFGDAGFEPAFNPSGQQPFSVTAMFRGNPADARDQTIVGHTTSSWRLWLSASGNLQWQIAGTTLSSSGIYNDGNWHQAVAVYQPASNPALAGTNALYVDGALDSSVSTASTNGIGSSSSDVMIGADPQYTNNPDALGQQFAGQICEVALFTNALTAAQAQQLYVAINPITVNASPTNIVFSLSGNQLTLSWPADHTGWMLQAQTNSLSTGIGTNWADVAGSTNGNQIAIPVNLTNGSVFYRLVYPPQ